MGRSNRRNRGRDHNVGRCRKRLYQGDRHGFYRAARWLIARAKRFAMYVVDGVVQVYAPEVGTGVCDLSVAGTIGTNLALFRFVGCVPTERPIAC